MKKIINIIILLLISINIGFTGYLFKQNIEYGKKINENNYLKINLDYLNYLDVNKGNELVSIPNPSIISNISNNKKEWINKTLGFKITLPNDWFPENPIGGPATKKMDFFDSISNIGKIFEGDTIPDDYVAIGIGPLNYNIFLEQEKNCKGTFETKDCFQENGEYKETVYNYFNGDAFITFTYNKNDKESQEIINSITRSD